MTVRTIGSIFALAAALAFSASPASSQTKQKFTIVASGAAMHQMILYVAQHAGYFAEEGLDLDSVVVSSGPRVVAAVQGGSADMGYLGCTEVTSAAAQGSSLALIGNGYDAYATSLVLSNEAIAKAGITPGMSVDEKIKRLNGLRISITGPGSTTDLMIRSLMLARGLDPDKEIKLQPLGDGASQLAAFQRKMTDGFIFGAPFPQLAEKEGIGKVVISPFDEKIPEMKGMIFLCFTASRETIDKKPQLLHSGMRALTRAIKLLREKPLEARAVLRKHYPDVEESIFNSAFDTYVKGVPDSPIITREELATTIAWRNIGNKTPMNVSYDAVVVNSIAEKVAKEILGK